MSETTSPLLVRDLMTVGVQTCPPETPLPELARLLLDGNLEAVVVLDGEEGHALGVVTQEDLARVYGREGAQTLTAEAVMQDGVPQVPPEIPLAAAAQMMLDQKVRALFIMHRSAGIAYPAAVVTFRHLLRHLAARTPEDLRDLGIGAERRSPLDLFFQRREEARKRNLKSNDR